MPKRINASKLCKAQTETIIFQMFRRILLGQILICTVDNLVGIVNGIIVGNLLNEASILIIGLTAPLTLLQSAFASCISAGACILYGRGIGRASKEHTDGAFSAAVILSCFCGLLLMLSYLFFSSKIALVLGAAGEAVALTAGYIRFLAVGMIAHIMIPGLSMFLQMSNDSYYSIFATSSLAGFTILFDILSVCVFRSDVTGIALAGSAAKFVVLLLLLGRIAAKKVLHFRFSSIKPEAVGAIMLLGIPSFVPILFALRDTFINRAAYGISGSEFVSGLAVFNTFGDILCSLLNGIVMAFIMLFNIYFGINDFESLRILLRRTIKTGLWFCLGASVALALFSNIFVKLYGVSGKTAEYAAIGLYSYIAFVPLNFLRKIIYKSYEAMGRTKAASAIIILVGFLIPFALISITHSKAGIYMSYALSEGLIILLVLCAYMIKNKRFPASLFALIYGSRERNMDAKLNFSIKKSGEIGVYAAKVQSFCQRNGIGDSESYHCALCLEEIARNTLECNRKAQNAVRQTLSIDVYIAIVEGKVKLRICDNGVLDDPRKKIGMYDPNDPLKNVGIRIVTETAEEMCYQSTFKMNVLSIVI